MMITRSTRLGYLALGFLCFLPSPRAAAEFRGLWVDAFGPGFFDAAQVRQLVADCRRYNFNAVLVEMRRRGDAFYDSRSDPRTTSISANFDALSRIIEECHTGTPRIEVHCWVVSHFIWSAGKPPAQPDHIFNLHPEYLTRDSLGQRTLGKGYFLDPGNPDANQTIHDMAKDIVSRYEIDGFHWDYCRYPNQDSGYNEKAIVRFNKEFDLKGWPRPKDPKFSDWRRRQVTDFLRWVNADLLQLRPNLVISIAVFANIGDSYGHRFADWPAWNREGIVDACLPMNFSPNNHDVFFPRADEALKHQANRHVYLGQAAYLNPSENTLLQLRYVREKGFPGFAFYSYRSPEQQKPEQETAFAFLKERFQPDWADTPRLPWKQSKGIIKGAVMSGQQRHPIYNAEVTLEAGFTRTLKTEPHGGYAFFDLSPADYTIRAREAQLGSAAVRLTVDAGQVVEANLNLSQ